MKVISAHLNAITDTLPLNLAKGFERPTEACQSVGMESWGYKKDEDYYTDSSSGQKYRPLPCT